MVILTSAGFFLLHARQDVNNLDKANEADVYLPEASSVSGRIGLDVVFSSVVVHTRKIACPLAVPAKCVNKRLHYNNLYVFQSLIVPVTLWKDRVENYQIFTVLGYSHWLLFVECPMLLWCVCRAPLCRYGISK